jgi:hypothetical protein
MRDGDKIAALEADLEIAEDAIDKLHAINNAQIDDIAELEEIAQGFEAKIAELEAELAAMESFIGGPRTTSARPGTMVTEPRTFNQRLVDVYRELRELGVDRFHVATLAETAAYEAAATLAPFVAPILMKKAA